MKKYRIYYLAEVEADDENEALGRVYANKDLLQFLRTYEVEEEEPILSRETLEFIEDLHGIKENLFDGMILEDAVMVYKNVNTKSSIYAIPDEDYTYCNIVYLPIDLKKTQVKKCINSTNIETYTMVIGGFIAQDDKVDPFDYRLETGDLI